jgi:hypothetical protein
VRFQVLTAAGMKKAVFWAVEPCSLVEVYLRCNNPKDSHLQISKNSSHLNRSKSGAERCCMLAKHRKEINIETHLTES